MVFLLSLYSMARSTVPLSRRRSYRSFYCYYRFSPPILRPRGVLALLEAVVFIIRGPVYSISESPMHHPQTTVLVTAVVSMDIYPNLSHPAS